jgi:hypothetical protein
MSIASILALLNRRVMSKMFGDKSCVAEAADRVAKAAVGVAVHDKSVPNATTLQEIRDTVETAVTKYYMLKAVSLARAECYVETQMCVASGANEAATRARVKLEFLEKNDASPESIAEAQILADELQAIANVQQAVSLVLQFREYNLPLPTSFDW